MGGYLIFKVTARLVPGIFKNQNQRTARFHEITVGFLDGYLT